MARGHLEPAAGMAGLIKAVLVLRHEVAPPNCELKNLNPKIASVVDEVAVRFVAESEPLRQHSAKVAGEALVAGVSSFGYAGTIAHVLVGQASKEDRAVQPTVMIGVHLAATAVTEAIETLGCNTTVSVAAANGSSSTILAGSELMVNSVLAKLGVTGQPLSASQAFQPALIAAETSLGSTFPNRKAFPWRQPPHPLLQQTLDMGNRGVEHTAVFHVTLMELFGDHTIEGRTMFPGAGFVEMALAAASSAGSPGAKRAGVELRGVSFLEPLDLEAGTALVCEVSGGGMEFRPAGEDRVVCAVAEVNVAAALGLGDDGTLAAARARCTEEVEGLMERYAELAARGFHGLRFQTLAQVWRSSDGAELVARLALPDAEECSRYLVHPAVLDGVFQLVGFVPGAAKAWVPAAIERLQLLPDRGLGADESGSAWASARVVEATGRGRVLELVVYDGASGGAIASVQGFRFMALSPPPPSVGLYEVAWEPAPGAVSEHAFTLDEEERALFAQTLGESERLGCFAAFLNSMEARHFLVVRASFLAKAD